jgi:hypothetical protein
MPLHVEIKVNETLIDNYHIGRMSGDTRPDTINEYVIVEGETPTTMDQWFEGAGFTHRYGDGAAVCVAKGLLALEVERENNN